MPTNVFRRADNVTHEMAVYKARRNGSLQLPEASLSVRVEPAASVMFEKAGVRSVGKYDMDRFGRGRVCI